MDKPLMKCGHSANAVKGDTKKPCCCICDCEEEATPPNLEGRFARCAYYGRPKPRRRFANDECNYGCHGKDKCECGKIPSSINLAFFEHKPAEEFDKFYCGCFGWD